MVWKMLFAVVLSVLATVSEAQTYGTCKEPTVEKRLLADDVRYASPFYVIGLPRNPDTEQMDNVCYSYFENKEKFFHVMSVTYKNGSNVYYKYSKGDISNQIGLAEANELSDTQCKYHDYTLAPICNVSVFILYRCFIEGQCARNIDIGVTPGVDVRVILAAAPSVSDTCQREIQASLRDTSTLKGADYVIFPQKLKPKCVTKYNNINSIGHDRAVGSQEVTEDYTEDRFGGNTGLPTGPLPSNKVQSTSANFNPYGSTIKGQNVITKPGQTATQVPAWVKNNGQWNAGGAPWDQSSQSHTAQHFHIWQAPTGGIKAGMPKNPNIYYHIHSWDSPPPGCCRCT